ncbi:MAG: hypothetical protein HC837_15080 [Chloroflexaceae bacterium]|nr:hypothetical protein [Chloroflexaceae bacterium]
MLTLISDMTEQRSTPRYEDVTGYLRATGWQEQISENQRWSVFTKASTEPSSPVEIVLPATNQTPDMQMHLIGAINAIAALQQTSVEDMIKLIAVYDRDCWSLRYLETGRYHSLALSRAIDSIKNIGTVVRTAGSSEMKALPHFSSFLSSGNQMSQQFRMGHTFRGSFGFLIESHITGSVINYYQESMFELDKDDNASISPIAPIERRVMERIARGLQAVWHATNTMDITPLVERYGSGFASNACMALAKLATTPVECRIKWSPRIEPTEDVRSFEPIILNETSKTLLEQAAQRLREIQPEQATIRGTVTHLTAKADPSDPETKRAITIKRQYPETLRSMQVEVSLGPEDYKKALNAHQQNRLVEVMGLLVQVGQKWRLDEPHNFHLLG